MALVLSHTLESQSATFQASHSLSVHPELLEWCSSLCLSCQLEMTETRGAAWGGEASGTPAVSKLEGLLIIF